MSRPVCSNFILFDFQAASVFDGFKMTQRIMHFPSEKFDTYLDMLITLMNSILDYIEMRFGYLMLKHIEGKVS